jgi:hypothetical protein
VVACSKPPQVTTIQWSKSSTHIRPEQHVLRDLSVDESSGGHTLSRHVGRSDADLRDRLAHEHVSAASTYSDRMTAEQAVGAALAANHDRITSWAQRSSGHPNLVLDYDSPTPLGRTLRRGESSPSPCSHGLVILKWKPPSSYYVLTSYPECR